MQDDHQADDHARQAGDDDEVFDSLGWSQGSPRKCNRLRQIEHPSHLLSSGAPHCPYGARRRLLRSRQMKLSWPGRADPISSSCPHLVWAPGEAKLRLPPPGEASLPREASTPLPETTERRKVCFTTEARRARRNTEENKGLARYLRASPCPPCLRGESSYYGAAVIRCKAWMPGPSPGMTMKNVDGKEARGTPPHFGAFPLALHVRSSIPIGGSPLAARGPRRGRHRRCG